MYQEKFSFLLICRLSVQLCMVCAMYAGRNSEGLWWVMKSCVNNWFGSWGLHGILCGIFDIFLCKAVCTALLPIFTTSLATKSNQLRRQVLVGWYVLSFFCNPANQSTSSQKYLFSLIFSDFDSNTNKCNNVSYILNKKPRFRFFLSFTYWFCHDCKVMGSEISFQS